MNIQSSVISQEGTNNQLELSQAITESSFIQSKYLDETFYLETRNELSPEKLNQLSELAAKIPEPKLFGIYANDEDYAKTLSLMLNSTAETRHRGIFFLRTVLPLLKNRERLLDIGPGDGQLTSWIGNKFKYIMAIDINKKVIDSLNVERKILRKYIKIDKVHDSILNVNLPTDYYDLGVLSHVMYYIDRAKWLETVERCYNAIKAKAILVVALSGDDYGKADLIRNFGGSPIKIDALAEQCALKFGLENVSVFISREFIITNDINSMLHIAGFFLCDAGVATTKDKLLDYFNSHYVLSGNKFKMSTQQKFILIHKK